MSNLAQLLPFHELLALKGVPLNQAIARQLREQQGADSPCSEHAITAGPGALEFATNTSLVLSLPLPEASECCEDWIHTEMGPEGRWIIRLVRFYRAKATQPWKSKELYVADRDDDPVPIATAYGRAWLFSHATWPAAAKPRTLTFPH